MKYKSTMIAFLATICLTCIADDQKKPKPAPTEHLAFDEPYNLTEALRIPPKTPITWVAGSLPKRPSYKLYLCLR